MNKSKAGAVCGHYWSKENILHWKYKPVIRKLNITKYELSVNISLFLWMAKFKTTIWRKWLRVVIEGRAMKIIPESSLIDYEMKEGKKG